VLDSLHEDLNRKTVWMRQKHGRLPYTRISPKFCSLRREQFGAVYRKWGSLGCRKL